MTPNARIGVLFVACVASGCVDQMAPDPPMMPSAVLASSDPVVVITADMVCGTGSGVGEGGGVPAIGPCKQAETASLVTSIAPDAVLLAGDIQYEVGSLSDFNTYYEPTWGVHKAITYPAPGNHEYRTAGAAGYFDYFNGVGVQTGRAGTRGQGYYSFNLGVWHIIALNSNCPQIGCAVGSAQEVWLRADLAANPAACTLAYWHHPRFSSGYHGNYVQLEPFWKALEDFGADLIIVGHDHDYERFAPQTSTGVASATGVRSFVVGTGGRENRSFGTVKANSQFRNSNSLGVLKLTLHPTSYDWQFMPIPGHTLNDAGSAACVGVAPPPPPPPPPSALTIIPSADAHTMKSQTTINFGTRKYIQVDQQPEVRTYLKFDVTGIGSKSIVSAKLRVYGLNPSNDGGRLHRVISTS